MLLSMATLYRRDFWWLLSSLSAIWTLEMPHSIFNSSGGKTCARAKAFLFFVGIFYSVIGCSNKVGPACFSFSTSGIILFLFYQFSASSGSSALSVTICFLPLVLSSRGSSPPSTCCGTIFFPCSDASRLLDAIGVTIFFPLKCSSLEADKPF